MQKFESLIHFQGTRHVGGYRARNGVLIPALADAAALEAYQPPDDVFREFANISPSEREIVAFANKFGLLGVKPARVTVPIEPPVQRGGEIIRQTALIAHGERLENWQTEIAAMQAALERWSAARQPGAEPQIFGLIDVRDLINARLGGLLPLELFLEGDALQLRARARTLLAYIYAQLAQAVAAPLIVRRCAACPKWMIVRAVRGPAAKRTTCDDACRARLSAWRLKALQLRRRGAKPARIARELGMDVVKLADLLATSRRSVKPAGRAKPHGQKGI